MFCKNCGGPMDPNAVVCVRCGCAKGTGSQFCASCGQPLDGTSGTCPACGAAFYHAPATVQKSKIAAGLLGIFLGSLGVHNFYLGYTGKGVAQLLISLITCGTLSFVSSIWGLVEGIMILTGSIATDASGVALKD
jgi:TM2 domain-containing membrane protein YozV